MIPLSTAMRPKKIEDFKGQKHFLYEGSLLYNSIKNKTFESGIFYGPSGTGKTTLALSLIHIFRGQIASGIDVVIHLSRLRDKTRRILDISEFLGFEQERPLLNCIFRFQSEAGTKGMLQPTGNKIQNTEKLEMSGLSMDDIL